MKFRDCVSEQSKELRKALYRAFMHRDEPVEEDKRGIHLEAKIEDAQEIEKMMQETPNYTISQEGRH